MYSQSVPALISKNVGNTLTNYKTWGSIIFNVMAYGAKGDGVTDDTAAINATIAAAKAVGGGVVYLPVGVYAISQTIIIGDGGTTESTYHNIKLIGVGAGESGDITSKWQGATRIKWIGASNGTMIKVSGPILGVAIEGIELDCNGIAGYGLVCVHMAYGKIKDVYVRRFTTLAIWHYVADASMAYGACPNVWEKIGCGEPANNDASGMFIDGSTTTTLDVCRNVFISLEIIYGGNTNSYGLQVKFADNNTFIEGTTFKSSGSNGGGKGLLFTQAENPAFPHSNTFYNFAPDSVGGAGGTVGNLFLPYADDSGEVFPTDTNLSFLTYDGRQFSGGMQKYGSRQIIQTDLQDNPSATPGSTWTTISGMTATITTKANSKLRIKFVGSLAKNVTGSGSIILNVDGVTYGTTTQNFISNGYYNPTPLEYVLSGLAAGSHTVSIQWKSSDSNSVAAASRVLIVEELR